MFGAPCGIKTITRDAELFLKLSLIKTEIYISLLSLLKCNQVSMT